MNIQSKLNECGSCIMSYKKWFAKHIWKEKFLFLLTVRNMPWLIWCFMRTLRGLPAVFGEMVLSLWSAVEKHECCLGCSEKTAFLAHCSWDILLSNSRIKWKVDGCQLSGLRDKSIKFLPKQLIWQICQSMIWSWYKWCTYRWFSSSSACGLVFAPRDCISVSK